MAWTLSDKRILITGAARGIGAESARRLAGQGARLSLVGLEPERLADLAQSLGPGHLHVPCDVTDQGALDRAVAATVEAFGGIDVVVANAGIANNGTVLVNPADALARTIDVNLTGAIRTVSAALPHVVESQGYVLLVSSAAAMLALPGMSAYAASKIGLEHFGSALRLEVAHRGVAVGVIHPSWIDTDLVRDLQSDLATFRTMLRRMPGPFGRTTSVEACADAVVASIAGRSRKAYVPRSIAPLDALRTLLWSRWVQRVFERDARRYVPELEREVRAIGRAFGTNSVDRP